MRLVCATEEWLRKYLELAKDRQLPFDPWPSRMALLVAKGKELVAGVMVYDSTGPFLFFEHLITNETASYRTRHQAVSLMADELVSMCRHFGKVPQVAVRHRGVKKILERAGLRMPGAFMMTCAFNHLEKHDYERSRETQEEVHPDADDASRCRRCSAPTIPAPAFSEADGP